VIYERIFHWKFAKRPNCNKILVEKHLWALGLHEFEVENELRTQKVNNKNENFGFFYILESKLSQNQIQEESKKPKNDSYLEIE
jgi:hypothetical protein